MAILLLGPLAGCEQKVPDTPEGVYRAFFEAVAARNWDQAVIYLSPEVVELFGRVGKRLQSLAEVQDEKPLDFFLKRVRADVGAPLRNVEILSRSQDAVVLKVTAGPCQKDQPCSVSEVRVVRNAGRWLLAPEVPEQLKQSVDPNQGR
jgi:hypothetical protein